MRQILQAWKQATTYIKENKQNITYAQSPDQETKPAHRNRPKRKLKEYTDHIHGKNLKNPVQITIQKHPQTQKIRKNIETS